LINYYYYFFYVTKFHCYLNIFVNFLFFLQLFCNFNLKIFVNLCQYFKLSAKLNTLGHTVGNLRLCILQNTQYFQLINLHTSYNIGKNLQNFANQIAYKVAGQRETNNFNEEIRVRQAYRPSWSR